MISNIENTTTQLPIHLRELIEPHLENLCLWIRLPDDQKIDGKQDSGIRAINGTVSEFGRERTFENLANSLEVESLGTNGFDHVNGRLIFSTLDIDPVKCDFF